MKNKKGKSFLGMLLLLIAIGVFGYFGYSTMNQIKLGLDLAGGVSITYQAVDENPTSEEMSDTIYKLQQRVQNYSTEAVVYQEGLPDSFSFIVVSILSISKLKRNKPEKKLRFASFRQPSRPMFFFAVDSISLMRFS